MSEASALRAPVDEVIRLEALYRDNYRGWSVARFHERYRDRHAGERSYTVTPRPVNLAQPAVGYWQFSFVL